MVSVALLGKVAVKLSFESEKIVVAKNNFFVGKNHCNYGLFVLIVFNVINDIVTSSAYLVESIDLWHGRLEHISISYFKKIHRQSFISSIKNTCFNNFIICDEAKLAKKPCVYVNKESELLSLIRTDLDDIKQTMTRGGR